MRFVLTTLIALTLAHSNGVQKVKTAGMQSGSLTEPSASSTGEIGGYQPVSDVNQHAKMSVDVCAINTLLDTRPIDFKAIGAIYRDGGSSIEASGAPRTLRGFARGSRSTEHLLGRYEQYWGVGWLDDFIDAAIRGTGLFGSETELVRRQLVQKGVRDQVLVAWAFHELDAAVEKAIKGDFAKATGAPHNWDEAWAYYHGQAPECAAYATAEERGREFGTKVNTVWMRLPHALSGPHGPLNRGEMGDAERAARFAMNPGGAGGFNFR